MCVKIHAYLLCCGTEKQMENKYVKYKKVKDTIDQIRPKEQKRSHPPDLGINHNIGPL